MKQAMFTFDAVTMCYWPANKNAIAACAILSKMRLGEHDMVTVKDKGFEPILQNGEPILRVNILV